MKEHYDVIFCVFGCSTIKKYKDEINKINETWGIKVKMFNYKLIFFLGEEKTDLEGDEYIYLHGVQNDYLSASFKQNLGLKYIYEKYNFDFVYICGTDTYVVIKNLQKYIKTHNLNPNDNICVGGSGGIRIIDKKGVFFHSGGPGLILSYKGLELIYDDLESMVHEWCKLEHNLNPCCDVAICYYLSKKECNLIIENNLFFHENFYGTKSKRNDIIACHNMSLKDFDDYTSFLECNGDNKTI